jgi:hypothetical protein
VPVELPDHLAVVCEVAAPAAGLRLLREQRVGVELLREALASQHSPDPGRDRRPRAAARLGTRVRTARPTEVVPTGEETPGYPSVSA